MSSNLFCWVHGLYLQQHWEHQNWSWKYETETKSRETLSLTFFLYHFMKHSKRAMDNMTAQLKAQLKFLQEDLKNEENALKKAKTFSKYKLPGIKQMIRRHKAGVRKTKRDLTQIKNRIINYQKEGKINKIL